MTDTTVTTDVIEASRRMMDTGKRVTRANDALTAAMRELTAAKQAHADATEMLWIGAFRYYCGRRTYAVSSFCEALIAEWDKLPERARVVIARDLEETFQRDDWARQSTYEDGWYPLGMDMDRAEWEKVRAAIRSATA